MAAARPVEGPLEPEPPLSAEPAGARTHQRAAAAAILPSSLTTFLLFSSFHPATAAACRIDQAPSGEKLEERMNLLRLSCNKDGGGEEMMVFTQQSCLSENMRRNEMEG